MTLSKINVDLVLDREIWGSYRLFVLAVCGLTLVTEGFDAQIMGFVAPAMLKTYGVNRSALGPVFAAGIVGLLLGAMILGPVADRWGRRPVIIGSLVFFGLCSLLTVTSSSMEQVLIWRFTAGIGFGGAIPNAIALAADYAPDRKRSTVGTVMAMAVPLGGAVGGPVVGPIVSNLGWHYVFYLGGFLPLMLAGVAFIWLPESVRLLAVRGRHGAVAKIVKLIDPNLEFSADAIADVSEPELKGVSVRSLFDEGRATTTVLLWVTLICSYYCLFFLANWLPTVITSSGHHLSEAVNATALFQLGGFIGGILFAKAVERYGTFVIAGGYVLAAGSIVATGVFSDATIGIVMLGTFCSGFFLISAQVTAVGITAAYYPTSIRSTGVGWAMGIARWGAISGPLVGGLLTGWDWTTKSIFIAAAIPAMIGAAAIASVRLGTSAPTSRELSLKGTSAMAPDV